MLENKSKLLVLENKSKLLVLESKSRYQLLKNYNKVVNHLNRIQISLQEQQEAQNFSNQSRTLDQSLQLGWTKRVRKNQLLENQGFSKVNLSK